MGPKMWHIIREMFLERKLVVLSGKYIERIQKVCNINWTVCKVMERFAITAESYISSTKKEEFYPIWHTAMGSYYSEIP